MKLVVQSLCGERSGHELFSDLSFELSAGEALVVIGRNGSGKSTMLRILAGLLRAKSGEVNLIGENEFEKPHEAMHYLGHQNALKSALSVMENLEFWRSYCDSPGVTPLVALEKIGLPSIADVPAGFLSAGQKRRVAIARLLVVKKPIWLIDEPTAALDKHSEENFGELVDEFLSGGGIVVAATHQPLGMKKFDTLDMADVRPTHAQTEAWI